MSEEEIITSPREDLEWQIRLQSDEIERLNNIIKEVREYIETKYEYLLGDDDFLDHDELVDGKQINHILEILDKGE